MATLTNEAAAAYQDYVNRVRACLAAAGVADPADVLKELQAHVDEELKDAAAPVALETVQGVLQRLGLPERWVSEDELPSWRRMLLRFRAGPEDWRLAYAAFGLLLCGVLLRWTFCQPARTGVLTTGVFIAASFIVARAALASSDRALVSGQKWLVYPSLLVVYVTLVAVALAWAPIAGGAAGVILMEETWNHSGTVSHVGLDLRCLPPFLRHDFVNDVDNWAVAGLAWGAVAAAGLWWTLLGTLLLRARVRGLAQQVFAPFLARMTRRWASALLIPGLLLLAIAIGSALFAYRVKSDYDHAYRNGTPRYTTVFPNP